MLTYYLIIINAALFLLMHLDKRHARIHAPRVPEKVLFAFSLLGGSLGGTVGIFLLRHKTRKPLFCIGFPVVLLLQVLIVLLLCPFSL